MTMSKMNALHHGSDIDTDALAETLERVAEGVREGEIMIQHADTATHAPGASVTEFELSLTFLATYDYADVTDPLDYTPVDTDDHRLAGALPREQPADPPWEDADE